MNVGLADSTIFDRVGEAFSLNPGFNGGVDMIVVLVEVASVQSLSDSRLLADHFEQDDKSPSVVDWDAIDEERCALFP